MSLSATFRVAKIPRTTLPPKSCKATPSSVSASSAPASGDPPPKAAKKKKEAAPWCVYLISSSRAPRTYVGVTTDFPRRLRQHNGELKGGAKASSAGRPWNLACLVEGFTNRSEACEFESKWKNISKKMTRKRSEPGMNAVLQHREVALSRVKTFLDCNHLNIKWHSS
ncbi:hypothetical protein CFC21_052647 [Triticum aestivum]|uniref:GIY-YIG domain-containing protein n=4 Tax=Triticum TaxID=4564 RepID=A0A9R0SE25_TRITD|nr:structure-specific endonuclease subunit slx1-like [Triticum dicoccoides]XP_044364061.1 structure-specific endonuclease subunit slx1-like [Triticum aestivum]XP_048570140.1 structure-specific endonuclease subunit slx1-like [Triticum urartu]XP_048570149.1 structure-specific endonuclease subunit slx1-like [Triticum urartu]VAH92744.1 unnamed protein product [Triticum turgidum subsp. durum]KAF7043263.1 hypothetical protein CFC21_052647 [Triticum aestivum]